MIEKPICLSCGKPLRKRTYSQELKAGAEAPKKIYGKDVIQVVGRKALSHRADQITERVSLWCGEWGGYGDNFFCSLTCGYSWAVMGVKMSEKERPGYVAKFRSDMKKFQEAAR